MVCVVIIVKCKKEEEIIDSDSNPVYGMYYFGDGEQMYDTDIEIVDENDYYEN